jgi:hypothetical protein
MLLRTRAAVLSKIGAEIVCSNSASALAVQADRECDVVVLCHSLREEVCAALAESLHEHWPKTRVLLVVTEREWGTADEWAAVDGTSSTEPDRLICRTAELLRGAGWVGGEAAVA